MRNILWVKNILYNSPTDNDSMRYVTCKRSQIKRLISGTICLVCDRAETIVSARSTEFGRHSHTCVCVSAPHKRPGRRDTFHRKFVSSAPSAMLKTNELIYPADFAGQRQHQPNMLDDYILYVFRRSHTRHTIRLSTEAGICLVVDTGFLFCRFSSVRAAVRSVGFGAVCKPYYLLFDVRRAGMMMSGPASIREDDGIIIPDDRRQQQRQQQQCGPEPLTNRTKSSALQLSQMLKIDNAPEMCIHTRVHSYIQYIYIFAFARVHT